MRAIPAARLVPVLLLGLTVPDSDIGETRPGACEAPAVEIRLGQEVRGTLRATDQPYPANATYYCVAVPEGTGQLTMTLSGMSVDLDLYVAHGTIRRLQGSSLQDDSNYEWKSNDFGTGAETIVLRRPRVGTYYIEIVSYEGTGSNFTFRASGS